MECLLERVLLIFSAEFGINYTTRNFILEIQNADLNLKDKTFFNLRSYELPLQLLAYIQISDLWYLNTAFGISHNVLASDIFQKEKKMRIIFKTPIDEMVDIRHY